MGDARLELEDALAGAPDRATAPPVTVSGPPVRRAREWAAWTLAILGIVAAGGFWWIGRRAPATDGPWQSFTQLTDLSGEEGAPAISPDGTSIAYASRARGSSDIYVQRIGGRNPIVVAGDPARDESAPAFSPNGQTLAFHEGDGDGGIFVAGSTGESARRLTDAGFHPAWSPDGKQIVYCSEGVVTPYARNSISSLWVVEASGGTPRKIHDGDAVQPVWSPSGRRIAFWAADAGQRDLFTVPADGGTRVPVFQDAGLDWSPTWSPDGRYLYFASDRGGAMNLWRVAIDESTGRATGQPEPVTAGVQAAADSPGFSKDGAKVVFRSRLASVNPLAVPFDPAAERLGQPMPLFRRTGIFAPTGISPDGKWLALVNLGERQEDIFICRTDGSDLRRLTDDVHRDRIPVWSPDGSELAFYSNRRGNYQVWVIKRDGSGLKQISEASSDDVYYPVYAPSGDRIVAGTFFTATNPPELFLWNVKQGWGSAKKTPGLTVGDAWLNVTDWSPDGRRLAGNLLNKVGTGVGVGVYDMDVAKARMVSDQRLVTYVQWLPDSRRVLVLTGDGELFVVDADSGRRRPLNARGLFHASPVAIALSPDGRTIYVGGQQVESDIWMVERAK